MRSTPGALKRRVRPAAVSRATGASSAARQGGQGEVHSHSARQSSGDRRRPVFAVAGGIAYAAIPDSTGVIHGCYRVSTDDQKGQLRVVDSPASCRSNELPIEWNVTGAPGPPGPPGVDGADGADGQDGEPFSGTFTSPNGQYSISVTDTGITLASPDSSIKISSSAIKVETTGVDQLELKGGGAVSVLGGATLELKGSAITTVEGSGLLALKGGLVRIGPAGSCLLAARVTDQIAGVSGGPGPVTGNIITGSSTVCIG